MKIYDNFYVYNTTMWSVFPPLLLISFIKDLLFFKEVLYHVKSQFFMYLEEIPITVIYI